MIRLSALLFVLLVAGCVSPEQQLSIDKSQCEKFGYQPGTDKYADCLKEFHLQRNVFDDKDNREMMRDF
ncbi:hypothetical protein CIG19_09430 [Enterobacterales bacterium CwR94]|nr:hypothetical protein CIG19_09430 [Enterobacterales bacterium CwR94]